MIEAEVVTGIAMGAADADDFEPKKRLMQRQIIHNQIRYNQIVVDLLQIMAARGNPKSCHLKKECRSLERRLAIRAQISGAERWEGRIKIHF